MSHMNTKTMLAYWEGQRDGFDAPQRSTVDPASFSHVVTQAFMIGRERCGVYPFRLAGALLEDLHRGPLSGFDFLHLWAGDDRPRLQAALEAALARRQPLVAHAHGCNLNGAQARLEIMLAPLAGRNGQVDRMLGFYQPTTPLYRLQNHPIERLFLLEVAFADGGEAAPSPLRLAAMDGRRIA